MGKFHKKKNMIIGLTAVCLAVSLFVLYEFLAPKSFLHNIKGKTATSEKEISENKIPGVWEKQGGNLGENSGENSEKKSEGSSSDTDREIENSADTGTWKEIEKEKADTEKSDTETGKFDTNKENSTKTGDEVIIALIDTGIDTEYEKISNYIWKNPNEINGNGIDDDGNGFADDLYGWDFYNDDNTVFHDISYDTDENGKIYEDSHGTHAACTIVGILNDILSEEASGDNICPKVKLMILKVNGGKESAGISSDALKAIKYAKKMGADICNLSWGTYEYDKYLAEEIKKSDMLFVCSAGNDGTDNDITPVYPGALLYDNVISVTGCEKTENGYQVTGNKGTKTVQLCTENGENKENKGNKENDNPAQDMQYEDYNMMGTSASAAKISGYVSVLMAGLDITAKEAKDILINELVSVRDIDGVKYGLVSMDTISAYVKEHEKNDNR